MKLYIPFCGCENDNFHSRCFSGHILVKKIILSELYCCNMIIFFCKLLEKKIVQASLCKGPFLAGEAV